MEGRIFNTRGYAIGNTTSLVIHNERGTGKIPYNFLGKIIYKYLLLYCEYNLCIYLYIFSLYKSLKYIYTKNQEDNPIFGF